MTYSLNNWAEVDQGGTDFECKNCSEGYDVWAEDPDNVYDGARLSFECRKCGHEMVVLVEVVTMYRVVKPLDNQDQSD